MFKALARCTCVFAWLLANAPCFGDSATTRNEALDAGERSSSILKMARETNEDVYTSLLSFVCNEQIERFRGRLTPESAKQIDTVTATVSFENGTEHYSDIRQNTVPRASMSSIAGAWSEGEFGTLLGQTQMLLASRTPAFLNFADLDGLRAAIYQLDVDEAESPWDLEVKGRHYRVPFRTRVWVSQESGQILKIERVSIRVPFHIGISEIRWSVSLKDVDLNGRTWLLPSAGEYAVSYEESGHREWNVMHFSNYHRYGSEVAIRFQ